MIIDIYPVIIGVGWLALLSLFIFIVWGCLEFIINRIGMSAKILVFCRFIYGNEWCKFTNAWDDEWSWKVWKSKTEREQLIAKMRKSVGKE